MKGDFARVTFDRTRHYSQVFQQQGRVLLEADWNEQGALMLHALRSLAADLMGPCWAAGSGFRIDGSDPKNPAKTLPTQDWRLSRGRFYVDGIPCENDYPSGQVARIWGESNDPDVTDGLVRGLFCEDLFADGEDYATAAAYWIAEGEPERMDADGNDVPCENDYDDADVTAYWG
jgi:hypothetical protein